MYWRKSCACCRNWKSSLHGSRWLILIGFLKIIGCKPTELSIYNRLSEKQKATYTTYFPCRTLNRNNRPSSLPWERARERATSRKACIWSVRVLEKIAVIRRMPSPQPSPTGEGAGCSKFCGFWQFEKQLGFSAVDFRSSEKQKVAHTTYFPCKTLNSNSHPVLSPRRRELERGQQAARLVFGRFRC